VRFPLTLPTELANSRSNGSEPHFYTGTLIEDLFSLVLRAEQTAASRSSKSLYNEAAVIKTQAACRANYQAEPRNSKPEKLAQALGLCPADWNLALLLIVHAQLVGTLEPGYNFANSINVHQIGAMSPPEHSRIQAGE